MWQHRSRPAFVWTLMSFQRTDQRIFTFNTSIIMELNIFCLDQPLMIEWALHVLLLPRCFNFIHLSVILAVIETCFPSRDSSTGALWEYVPVFSFLFCLSFFLLHMLLCFNMHCGYSFIFEHCFLLQFWCERMALVTSCTEFLTQFFTLWSVICKWAVLEMYVFLHTVLLLFLSAVCEQINILSNFYL